MYPTNRPYLDERDRCRTLYQQENRPPIIQQQQPPVQPIFIAKQSYVQKLEGECKRLEYHLRQSQSNFQQLKVMYDADQQKIQQIYAYNQHLQSLLDHHTSEQTKILDLEQENFYLLQQVECLKKQQLESQDLETQRNQVKQEQTKLLELTQELQKELNDVRANPLLEVLEKFRDRVMKPYTVTSERKLTTKEKYTRLARLTMQAAELMSFKLKYK